MLDEVDGGLFGGDCFSVLLGCALGKVSQVLDKDMDSFDMKVLNILRDVVKLEKFYGINDIKGNFDYDVNSRSVGYSLARLKLDGGKKRKNDGMYYWLSPDMVLDKWERYCKK